MGPIEEGIVIGIGSTAGLGILTFLITALNRVWKTPKRLDRVERVLPVIARGVWALLGEHVREHNGDASPEITQAYTELTDVVTNGVVSQKTKGP
jgi:hypothetical protein